MSQKIITVKPDGSMEFVYNDKLRGLIKQGEAKITRASTIEPGDPSLGQDPLRWYATMFDGPVLGPFETREQALAEEEEWINKNLLTSQL